MRNKSIIIIIFYLLIFSFILFGEDNQKIKPHAKGFQIEIFSGLSFINPADLNLGPQYRREYWDFYRTQYYQAKMDRLPGYFVYSSVNEGQFKTIKNAIPFGGRIKYFINPSLALSLGLKYFHQNQSSQARIRFELDDFYEGSESEIREVDPLRIYFEGYIPMVGLHYIFARHSAFNVEAYLSAGLLFASCGYVSDEYVKNLDSSGFTRELEYIYDYRGSGTGYLLESGARFNLFISQTMGFFAEGSYSLQRVDEISGQGSYEYREKDSNSDGYSEKYEWDGKWVVNEGTTNRDYGSFNYAYFEPEHNPLGSDNFMLNLSGFSIKIGFFINL